MTGKKRDFDSDAQHWDENPGRVNLANSVADAILEEVELTQQMDALDFGCGTGLVTLRLQPYVRSITGVDGSHGMLDVLRRKINKSGLKNVRIQFIDAEAGQPLEGRYGLIVSSMTFHHISDIKPVLDQFSRIALPSAYLCIADLDPEGGLFHEDKTGVSHFGFDRNALSRMIVEAGFELVRHRTAAAFKKRVGNREADFTLFLIVARKCR